MIIILKKNRSQFILYTLVLLLFTFSVSAKNDSYSLQTGTYSVLNKVHKNIDEGKNDEALEKLKKIIASGNIKDYDAAVIYQTIGFVQNNLGDFKASAENFVKALSYEALPEDITHNLYYTVTQLLIYSEKYQEGLEYILKWFANEKEPKPEAYILAATAYYYLENYQEVIAYASKALPLTKTPPLNWYELLLSGYYETEDLNNAAIILENIIIKYPTKKNYWVQLAGIYQRLGNDKRALAIYELAYLKNFLKKEEIIQLCKNYLYFEMPYKAAIVLEKEMAIGKIDTSLKMLNMLVDGWILAQENEKAESVFNEIINLYNDEKSRLRLGQLYIENEEWNKATDVLNIELETEDITLISKINLLLGIAQFNTENLPEAKQSFTQALADKTTREQAEWWLDHIKRKTETNKSG
jgi:tetratricopeptide (TPR) repeat protein